MAPQLKAPEIDLINTFNTTGNFHYPTEPPYVRSYKSGQKELRFIAATHDKGIEGDNLQTVAKEFEEFEPDAVVVEGVINTGTHSPPHYLELCQRQYRGDQTQLSESAYATILADQYQIPFIPGEPSHDRVISQIKSQGFTEKDYLGWQLSMVIKTGQIKTPSEVDTVSLVLQKELGQNMDNFDYYRWYSKTMGHEFTFDRLAEINVAPSDRKDTNIFQKITYATDRVRDPHILEVIYDQLTKHDKVLVVYGAAHETKQQPVLEQMLDTKASKARKYDF